MPKCTFTVTGKRVLQNFIVLHRFNTTGEELVKLSFTAKNTINICICIYFCSGIRAESTARILMGLPILESLLPNEQLMEFSFYRRHSTISMEILKEFN